MAKQEQFITSHRTRVNKMKEYVKTAAIKPGFLDREAVVEFYLLEDIVRLYTYLHDMESKRNLTTKQGKIAHADIMKKYVALINVFTAAAEVTSELIISGDFAPVWKAIPEGPLMRAAGKTKYLGQMRDMALDLLKGLSKDSKLAQKILDELNDATDDIENDEANWAALNNLDMDSYNLNPISDVDPETADINEPENKPTGKNKPTGNLN